MGTLASGLPEQVGAQENLARFLVQSNQFNQKMVKPAAFLPNPRDRETSVTRHGPEPVDALWALGLVAAGEWTLYGASIFKAQDVRSSELEVAADEPPPRHAVIRGRPWIDSDPEMQKAKQKELASLLASRVGAPLLRRFD